ncbi:hypothetical protein [uncultured Roseovarius sp.]|uniref:hypothetical protein n=1 Tax=uncultured Roseovarius sp. TaxID=293344 RepID=UPI0026385A05|nr:hypothetical protein [uncultured Roseovarius sp.]
MISIEAVFLGATLHGIALVLLLLFNGYANRKANVLLSVLVALLTITMWNVYVYRSDAGRAHLIIDYYLWVRPDLLKTNMQAEHQYAPVLSGQDARIVTASRRSPRDTFSFCRHHGFRAGIPSNAAWDQPWRISSLAGSVAQVWSVPR